MWTYYPELLTRPVPRYTSYPTAAEFDDTVGADAFAGALDQVASDAAMSLYVHIPFCKQICWYCGCNTDRANRRDRLNGYMDALFTEIGQVARALNGRGRVQRIAFGGGSPNALSAVEFARLVDLLSVSFQLDDPALSVEIDPRSFEDSWLSVLSALRFTHASLGVQTFDPHVQAAIGRVQPLHEVENLTHKLRDAGLASLNFDLMYGLPGQDMRVLEESLSQTVRLCPDRVALFGYAHVPDVIARQRVIDAHALPDARTRFDMAAFGHDYLVAAGYRAIGFDHFALPDDPLAKAAERQAVHRNFQGFTDDPAEILLGFGASAISQFPDRLIQNEKNSGRYRMRVMDGQWSAARGAWRSADDRAAARIIEGLLCHGTAPVADHVVPRERLAPFIERQLVRLEAGTLTLSDAARPYARTIAALFDRYRGQSAGTFSAAV